MTATITKSKDKTKKTPTRDRIQFVANGSAKRSPVLWDAHGWLAQSRRHQDPDLVNPLSLHADWRGPVKLVNTGNKLRRVTEMFLSHSHFDDRLFEREAIERRDKLFDELMENVFVRRIRTKVDGWEPPDTTVIADWLSETGRGATIDDDSNLRLTLKSRGCDGQVRVTPGEGQLRMTMRLGSWNQLDPTAEQAMLQIADEANARVRLARVAWIEDGDKRRCEAQVDLTGMPTSPAFDSLWPDVLRSGVDGLELLLRWLGMELEALADKKNLWLAEQLLQARNRHGRKPR